MEKVILQLWEETDKNLGITPDGCSLHLDSNFLGDYINSKYLDRAEIMPDTYDRVVGDYIVVSVKENIYNILKENKSIRLMQYEMNNLIGLNEIIVDL